MEHLQLIAPVRSKFMFQEMKEAGADEIYVGLKSPLFKQLSFDNRFQTIAGFPAHFESPHLLEEVIKLSKRHNIKVNFMANAPFIPKDLEREYITFVKEAVALGIDYITVSSLQAIHLIKEAGITLPLVSGSMMAPTNEYGAQMLKEMGVNRITVPHSLRPSEIKSWKHLNLGLIVIGNFGTGSLPGSCRLWESPNNEEIGEGIRSAYHLEMPDGTILQNKHALDNGTDCSLCNLEDLVEAGVTGIKLIGREAPNPVTIAMVVDLFKQWKDLGSEGVAISEKIQAMERDQLMWIMKWAPRFCQKHRCTYLPTPTTLAYV